MMSESSRIAKNTIYLYIKTGITAFIVLYTTRLILRSLGETDFGIYNIVGGVISMLGFLNTAMAVSIQRFLNYEQGKGDIEKQRVIFNVGIWFHMIIALVLSIILTILGIFLFDGILNIPVERMHAAKIVYLCMIVSTAFTVLAVPYDACLNAHENMLYYSIVGIVEAILKLIVAIIVIHSSEDRLIIYGILMAILPLFSMSLMRYYCKRHYSECVFSIHKYYDKDIAIDMSKFAGWNLLGTSSNYLGNYGNMIVMNHFYGTAMNTVMGIANQLQGQMMVLSTGLLKALNPVIAKEEGSGNSSSMLRYSLKGCELSYFLLSLFSIPFFVEAQLILDWWLGEYPKWTVLFVQLQFVRAMLEQVTVSLSKALEAKNKISRYNLIVFIFNLIPIPILSILYSMGYPPYWHFIVSISFMVVVPMIAKLYLCKKYCGLKMKYFSNIVGWPVIIYTMSSFFLCYCIHGCLGSNIYSVLFELLANILIIFSVFLSTINKKKYSVLIDKYIKH